MRHRIAVDIGGTFTDVALETPERHYTAKTLTTKGQPENGVLSGIRDVLNQSGIAPSQVTSLIYGTTLATNLLIERGGAPIALLTTRGFRDSIEMRNENRFEQYDVNIDLPAPLVPRAMRFSISERISAGGDVLLPLNENDVRTLTPSLLAAGVRSIAIGFLHSYRNGAHEQRVRDILREELPAIEVTLSSEVSPEMREFERISTACANAYVQPLMSGHLRALDERLREAGLTCPLFLMLSGGGITTLDTAVRFPVRLVESGPAGGAIFSSHIATELGLDEVMSYDMGGTTAKICLIDGGQPQTARTFEVAREYRFLKGSGIPLRIPVIEMVEIGAGGGSIAGVDAMQRISVGPGSAGSDPGPACYGLGGSSPTVTDADVTLGRIDPNNFAGGRMRLDALAAGEVLSEAVAKPLGFSVEHAALGVSEIVDENMANAARVHAIESGKSIDTRTIVAFGGAAPIHVCRLAEKLGVRKVVIPLGAGVGSALGFLRAPVSYEVIRSHYQQLSTLDVQKTNELLETMRNEAVTVVEAGAPGESLEQIQTAFMRYIGQGHEVGVEIPVVVNEVPLRETGAQTLRETFEHEYHRLYERTIPGVEVEVLSWALSVSTPRDVVIAESATTERSVPPPEDQRPLMDPQSGSYSEAPCYSRDALEPGATIVGPAVIVEQDTATVVASGYTAAIHPSGYIVLESKA